MGSTLTIRNLDEAVKRKLRIRAAQHGRSMEAEARVMLGWAVAQEPAEGAALPGGVREKSSVCGTVRGRWKGRMTTNEIMNLTRGD